MSELYSMLKAKKTGASSGGGGGATVNNATITIQKNGTTVDSFTSNQATDKTINITVPTSAADVSALPTTTKYASALRLTINSSTFVVTGQLIDQDGNDLGTAQTIDLPLESVVVDGSYNSQTKKVVLTLQNGNTIEFSVADLVSGLQTELSASNKLNPAYINYDSTHRAVSDTEKSTWNSKQNAIDSSHKLSADLVDDTNATNKFATAEELEQIQTNKNNISSAQNQINYNTNTGVKNLLKENTVTFTGTDREIAATPMKGEMVISLASAVSTDTDASTCIIIIYATDDSTIATRNLSRGVPWNSTFSTGDKTLGKIAVYSSDNYVHGSGDTATYTDMMICLKSIYDSDSSYQPYAMSNAELTAAIQALQAQLNQ